MNNDELFEKLHTLLSIPDINIVNYIKNNVNLYEYVCNKKELLNLYITQNYYLQSVIKADIEILEKLYLTYIIPSESDISELPYMTMTITPDTSAILEMPEMPKKPEMPELSAIPLSPIQNKLLNPNATEFYMNEYFLPSDLLDFSDIK
jgi:hypothetical protein